MNVPSWVVFLFFLQNRKNEAVRPSIRPSSKYHHNLKSKGRQREGRHNINPNTNINNTPDNRQHNNCSTNRNR
jgi:hypothetical protein